MQASRASRTASPLLAVLCLVASLLLGWTSYAHRINNIFYDLYFRQRGSQAPDDRVVIVAIDDATLARFGGLPLNRTRLADAIGVLRAAGAKVIGMDLLLTDVTTPDADEALARALEADNPEASPVVLATALEADRGSRWLLPLPSFARSAAALGHVHADPDGDGVSRHVLLERSLDRQRYWTLALECFRIAKGDSHAQRGTSLTETDDSLEVSILYNNHVDNARERIAEIPARRLDQRELLINYAGGNETFPQISLASLGSETSLAAKLRNKIVLLGVTAQGTGDRLFMPFSAGTGMAGVEIHANILNTLLTGKYLLPVGDLETVVAMLGIILLTLWVILRWHGAAQTIALLSIAAIVFAAPYALFLARQVWPAFSLLLSFAVALLTGEAYQLPVFRKRIVQSEERRRRSQQQFEMAAHEIRTPLAAIQASSELLSRYSLDDARREQMVRMLNEESKRLGKLVERFLAVERLSAGEMELRLSRVNLSQSLSELVERLRPVAARKEIEVVWGAPVQQLEIEADAELLDFAVSNLLNNAVKYSPRGTTVQLVCESDGEAAQIHVCDSGEGMTVEETRSIFERFYRTERAEQSQAPGFGLGLAIAREIARHHGGDISVQSSPGEGSRFTILLPLKSDAKNIAEKRKTLSR